MNKVLEMFDGLKIKVYSDGLIETFVVDVLEAILGNLLED